MLTTYQNRTRCVHVAETTSLLFSGCYQRGAPRVSAWTHLCNNLSTVMYQFNANDTIIYYCYIEFLQATCNILFRCSICFLAALNTVLCIRHNNLTESHMFAIKWSHLANIWQTPQRLSVTTSIRKGLQRPAEQLVSSNNGRCSHHLSCLEGTDLACDVEALWP